MNSYRDRRGINLLFRLLLYDFCNLAFGYNIVSERKVVVSERKTVLTDLHKGRVIVNENARRDFKQNASANGNFR